MTPPNFKPVLVYSRPQYQRLPRKEPQPKQVKSMTIAAGFLCSDGVVLCTDSEYTAGQSKHYAAKVFEASAENAVAYLAGAGDHIYIKSAADGIKEFIGGKTVSTTDIEACAESVISTLYKGAFLAARQANDPNAPTMIFLMATHVDKEGAKLFRIREDGTSSIVDESPVIVGSEAAETLLRELANLFFMEHLHSVYTMRMIAPLLIRRVVGFAAYCGGKTQIACLEHGGPRWFDDSASADPGPDYLGEVLADMPLILELCAKVTWAHCIVMWKHLRRRCGKLRRTEIR